MFPKYCQYDPVFLVDFFKSTENSFRRRFNRRVAIKLSSETNSFTSVLNFFYICHTMKQGQKDYTCFIVGSLIFLKIADLWTGNIDLFIWIRLKSISTWRCDVPTSLLSCCFMVNWNETRETRDYALELTIGNDFSELSRCCCRFVIMLITM